MRAAPAGYSIVQSSPASLIAAAASALLLAILIAAPWWAGSANMRLLGEIYLYLALASLWNLLAGYAGLVSVGQQAYVGFGGYGLFALTMFAGVHPLLAVPLVGAAGVLIAVPAALLIFRLRGAYFAIGTWVIAEVFRLGTAQISALGGGSGTSLPTGIVKTIADTRSLRETYSYWMALGVAVLVLAFVYLLLRSARGLALTAIRDNELASKSFGIDIWRTKFLVYIATAGLTAAVGALIFLQKLRISPDAAFSVNDWTAFVIFIVVIGGIGTIEGPIVGTIVFFLLRETLADLGTVYLLILGAVAIAVMLRAPKGIWGFVRARSGIELFPLMRRVIPNKAK
jgi:branched-chain amino acid transport system permease protein